MQGGRGTPVSVLRVVAFYNRRESRRLLLWGASPLICEAGRLVGHAVVCPVVECASSVPRPAQSVSQANSIRVMDTVCVKAGKLLLLGWGQSFVTSVALRKKYRQGTAFLPVAWGRVWFVPFIARCSVLLTSAHRLNSMTRTPACENQRNKEDGVNSETNERTRWRMRK